MRIMLATVCYKFGAIKKGKGKYVVHAKSKLSIDPVTPPAEVLTGHYFAAQAWWGYEVDVQDFEVEIWS